MAFFKQSVVHQSIVSKASESIIYYLDLDTISLLYILCIWGGGDPSKDARREFQTQKVQIAS